MLSEHPWTLDEPFELVQRGQGSPYKLKRTPKPAEKMSRPAEMNAEWLRHPTDHTDIMLTALGRVPTLLQGLGGYTRGCADAPPRRELHKFEELNPQSIGTRVTKPPSKRAKSKTIPKK